MPPVIEQQVRIITGFLPNLLAALLILIVGWIIAAVIAGLVKRLLQRTDIDNRIARSTGASGVGIEEAVGTVVFWLIMLFVLLGFFQALNLTIVSDPLNAFLSQILSYLPRLFSAAVLLLLAWLIATVLKRLVTGLLSRMGVDRRLQTMVEDETPAPGDEPPGTVAEPASTAPPAAADRGVSLASSLGEVVYWLVFLLFLPAILGTLELEGILTPFQGMLNKVFVYLPNILAAALILLVGWFIARIVRRIVTSLLVAAGVDRLGDRVGLSGVLGNQTLSGLIGLLVYIFILVPVAISALNALAIEAITAPATGMLNSFLGAIPNIFAAAVVLGIAYVVGRLVSSLVSNLLAGIGFDRWSARLALAGRPESAEPTITIGRRSPSDLVGSLVLIAIMLFAVVEAMRLLGFLVLADLLAEFIQLGGQVLLGLAIFAVGLYLANLAADLIRSSGATNANLVATAAKVAILVLAAAMGLRQMGLANEIVNLAFGLLLGAIAVAVAIAFGFGGRELAGRQLERWSQGVQARPPASGLVTSSAAPPTASPATPPSGPEAGGSPPA
jgi:hypothetical protein